MELKDIPQRLRLMNRRQADLARHLQLDPSSLTKTLNGQRRVQPAEVIAIEAFFGEKLVLATVAPQTPRRRAAGKPQLFGYASDDHQRIAFAPDKVTLEVEPPPFWDGVGELAYVRQIGEEMEPRYLQGEVIPIRLNVPPAKGGDCLVELTDGTAILRTYDGQRQGSVFVKQYNEPRLTALLATQVRALHAVWKPNFI